jgi:hypothetical protein
VEVYNSTRAARKSVDTASSAASISKKSATPGSTFTYNFNVETTSVYRMAARVGLTHSEYGGHSLFLDSDNSAYVTFLVSHGIQSDLPTTGNLCWDHTSFSSNMKIQLTITLLFCCCIHSKYWYFRPMKIKVT